MLPSSQTNGIFNDLKQVTQHKTFNLLQTLKIKVREFHSRNPTENALFPLKLLQLASQWNTQAHTPKDLTLRLSHNLQMPT
ncbi:hypothetical protein CEXT_723361 [Caerostris extrusa]|uniref:Uncharacterized protein n=1 Tax=Caerostris extrusa TaxID=172846 RepID=A0AAV4WA52_CAEEX|nr:hypothetical protein CEXT_723361 [Caerostris extrusa]